MTLLSLRSHTYRLHSHTLEPPSHTHTHITLTMRQQRNSIDSVLQSTKTTKQKLKSKILLPYRRLGSLADEGTVAATVATRSTTITREPPSDMQVVTEACDWCGVDAPWVDEEEIVDDASILEEKSAPTHVNNSRPLLSSRTAADTPVSSKDCCRTLGPKLVC